MGSFILHAASEETSSGHGDPVSVGNVLIGMFVNISSASGVLPTLVVKLQQSPNGNDWYDVSGVTTASLGGLTLVAIPASANQLVTDSVRASWTIGGVGARFTFEVDVETVG